MALGLGYFQLVCFGLFGRRIFQNHRKNLPVSSIRIKKFTSSSEFESSKSTLDNFKAPFSLEEGLKRTWNSEFISPDPDREIFFTE